MLIDDFFEMEEKYQLFDIYTENGMPCWDLFRYQIYVNYFWPNVYKTKAKQIIDLGIVLSGFKIISRSIFSFFFRRSNNILFSYSRHLNGNNFLYDKVAQHVVDVFNENILIVENVKASAKYLNKAEHNFSFVYKKIIYCNKKFPIDNYKYIEDALINTFGDLKISYDELNKLYNFFLKDYRYYRFYFKLKGVKRLFLVQNGIQKGLFAAANSLGIEIFELQHGSFGKDHLAYSYPSSINPASNIFVPNYLLTFGKSWGKNMNIPMRVIPIGNDYFTSSHPKVISDDSVLFVSSIIHGEELSKLAVSLSRKYPNRKINFKLHTNEYFKISFYESLFKDYPNICILKNEKDLSELIANSTLVVLINSTVLYEAINQKVKVAIYKKINYLSQSDTFKLPNVYLFDNLDELQKAIDAEKKESDVVFFEKFDQELFYKLIKK
ncbi:MAG: hypothetical protein JXQ69_01495 [Paludibacteraceae bacterium]|nr:hypothetical protein [Paludibacteraceae bacterium]